MHPWSCGFAQAYHNELVSKVSQLEEDNLKLKKEKVESSSTPKTCFEVTLLCAFHVVDFFSEILLMNNDLVNITKGFMKLIRH